MSTVPFGSGPDPALSVDVCVIGGGPAGAGAAIAARSAGAQVCLITADWPRLPRLELLSGRARTTLARLGLVDAVSSAAQSCAGSVIRWTDGDFDEHSCLLDPGGGGWIIDRSRLDETLGSAAGQLGVSVIVQRVVDVEGLSAQQHRVRLLGREVLAEVVIIAAGATRNPVRRSFDRQVRRRMVALGMRFEPEAIGDLGHRLLVDRAPEGWWYAIADRSATDVVYCTDAELAKGANGIRAAWASACVSAAAWLPWAARQRRPWVRRAAVGMGTPSARGRVRLLGDAALAVDPLSGMGIALAIEGAARWNDVDYADWLTNTAAGYERMESEVYRGASGVDGAFWDRRRG